MFCPLLVGLPEALLKFVVLVLLLLELHCKVKALHLGVRVHVTGDVLVRSGYYNRGQRL